MSYISCVDEEKQRIQVTMSKELRNQLRALAGQLNIKLDTDKWGTGTVAAELLEKLMAEHPELIDELLAAGHPKAESQPQAKRKKAA